MTPLHTLGKLVRQAFLAVPLSAARLLFVGLLVAILIWVVTLPAAATRPASPRPHWSENLKIWAAVALLIQIVIYALV